MTTLRTLKIALVNLASEKDNWEIVMVPLGIQYISAALRAQFGDRVEIIVGDMGLIPQQTFLRPVAESFLADVQPDIIGIRGFSSQSDVYPMVAEIAKAANPSCIVVAGGPHAATLSLSLFKDSNIDLIVPLEGEITFVELVADILAGGNGHNVTGVQWWDGKGRRTSGSRPLISDLDTIEFPDYTGIDLDAYQEFKTMTGLRPKGKATSLFTTRGCYFQCTYCHDHFGKTVRKRSIENVYTEMEGLMASHGVTEFQIVDDIFNADRKRAIDFFDGVVKRNWKLSFAFPNGLRGDLMTEEFIAAAKEAGTYHWSLAIESASPRIQKLVKKHNKLDRLRQAIELSDKYNIFTSTFTMFGFPTETRKEMQLTIDDLLSSAAHMALMFHVQPFEGTEIRNQVTDLTNGKMDAEFGYSTVPQDSQDWFTEVSPAEIRKMIQDTSLKFHFDDYRLTRMIDLTDDCHSKTSIAEYIDFCVTETGYDLQTLPVSEVVRSKIAKLLREAGGIPHHGTYYPFNNEIRS